MKSTAMALREAYSRGISTKSAALLTGVPIMAVEEFYDQMDYAQMEADVPEYDTTEEQVMAMAEYYGAE